MVLVFIHGQTSLGDAPAYPQILLHYIHKNS